MQVYDTLRILTARPSESDLAEVPHLLFGYVAVSERHSAGKWLEDIGQVLQTVQAENRTPILVGGSGLYLRLLTEGLADIPDIPDEIRKKWQTRLKEIGAEALHGELAARDAAGAARIPPSDPTRIVRALEVYEATGKPLHVWHADAAGAALVPLSQAETAVISIPRAELHQRIEERFDRMVAVGAISEAEEIAALNLDPNLPAMKAIGVPEFLAAARGELSSEQAITDAKTATRRYAKRQETWFRHQAADWPRLQPSEFDAWLDRAESAHLVASKT